MSPWCSLPPTDLNICWLRIKLETYACPSCKGFEELLRRRENNYIVQEVLDGRFGILRSWSRRQSWYPIPSGLTLEISMYSPSDS